MQMGLEKEQTIWVVVMTLFERCLRTSKIEYQRNDCMNNTVNKNITTKDRKYAQSIKSWKATPIISKAKNNESSIAIFGWYYQTNHKKI